MVQVPSVLIGVRAAIGPGLLFGALLIPRWAIVLLAAIGFVSDVLDGMIARRLGVATQRIRVADSLADACFYGCAAAAVWRLEPGIVRAFSIPLLVALGALLATYAVDVIKYGRPAPYHSWMAKLWNVSLFCAFVGVVLLRRGVVLWPAVAICLIGCAAGIAMTCVIDRWTYDVPTLWHALRLRSSSRRGE